MPKIYIEVESSIKYQSCFETACVWYHLYKILQINLFTHALQDIWEDIYEYVNNGYFQVMSFRAKLYSMHFFLHCLNFLQCIIILLKRILFNIISSQTQYYFRIAQHFGSSICLNQDYFLITKKIELTEVFEMKKPTK